TAPPLVDSVAAISVGIVDRRVCLDLAYAEDSSAAVDMNVVMTGGGRFVEVQGTAETKPFTAAQLVTLTTLAREGIARVTACARGRRHDVRGERAREGGRGCAPYRRSRARRRLRARGRRARRRA